MSHPTSFASLPEELQVMVASYIPQHNAAVCLRVCRAWRRIFTPFVWRNIEAGFSVERKDGWYYIFLESARSGSLKPHGQWIQTINLECPQIFTKEFLDLSPETFPRLTSLTSFNLDSDSLIASFIRKAPSSAVGHDGSGSRTLETSGPKGFSDFGGSSMDALLEHASTLEVVRLDVIPYMSSKSIQQFLCSAARLKEFDIIGFMRNPNNEDLFLDAHDVISPDWVSTELEAFGCQIGGIPRPDITRDIAYEPIINFIKEGIHQESLDLQRGVYSQLNMVVLYYVLHFIQSINGTNETIDRKR